MCLPSSGKAIKLSFPASPKTYVSALRFGKGSREAELSGKEMNPNAFCLERKKVKSLSRVRPFATPWTVALQAPLSVEFFRQECRSGLPFPSPGGLNLGIEPRSPALRADALPSESPRKSPATLSNSNTKHFFLLEKDNSRALVAAQW